MNTALQLVTQDVFNYHASTRILLDRIDRIAGLQTTRVLYFDGAQMRQLRAFPPMCQKSYLTVVIRKTTPSEQLALQQPTIKKKESDSLFSKNLVNSLVNCSAAAVSWIAFGGSLTAIPFTAGGSGLISVLSLAAGVASSAQCIDSGVRMATELGYLDPKSEQWLDSREWYKSTMIALDLISLASVASSAQKTVKMVQTLRKAGAPLKDALKGLNRHQRRRLTVELIRIHNPGVSNGAIKAMVAAGVYPKRFGKVELSKAVRVQLTDAVAATLSVSSSAVGGALNSAGGLAVGAIEEFDVF